MFPLSKISLASTIAFGELIDFFCQEAAVDVQDESRLKQFLYTCVGFLSIDEERDSNPQERYCSCELKSYAYSISPSLRELRTKMVAVYDSYRLSALMLTIFNETLLAPSEFR